MAFGSVMLFGGAMAAAQPSSREATPAAALP
jgi:hypothetical protein